MQLLEYCLDEWIPAAAEEELLDDVRYIIELYMREWLGQSQIELAEYIESSSRYSINGEPSRNSKNSSSVESMHHRVKDLSLGNVHPPKIARNVVPILGRY